MIQILQEPRPSPIAGSWYPADPSRLSAMVDGFLGRARLREIHGQPVGIIAPHAGLVYSGATAGHAFAALKGLQPELVAVVSPLHHYHEDLLLTTAHAAYQTPLGRLEVDQESLAVLEKALRGRLDVGLTAISKDREHSLEIELPFLQRVFPNPFKLLPVMVRAQNPQVSRLLGEALAEALSGRNALLVASTDLSHFYDQAKARQLDETMLACFEDFDPQRAFELDLQGKGFACGLGAVTAVLWACRALGADRVQCLAYATSGDVTGDFSSVVGYGAAVILKPAG